MVVCVVAAAGCLAAVLLDTPVLVPVLALLAGLSVLLLELRRGLRREAQATRAAVAQLRHDARAEAAASRERLEKGLSPLATHDGLGSLRREVVGLGQEAADLRDEIVSVRAELDAIRAKTVSLHDGVTGLQRSLRQHRREYRTTTNEHDEGLRQELRQLAIEPVREVIAGTQLLAELPLPAPAPPTGGWALDPSLLLRLVHLVRTTAPGPVLECGSGSSTVWLGHAVRRHGGRVIALEHLAPYAERTRSLLEEHGLLDVVEVRHAPLMSQQVGEETWSWYAPESVADLHDIRLLLVDGPPQRTGPLARYPAVPLLAHRLRSDAWVMLDDVVRPDERAVSRRWVEDHGLRRVPGTGAAHLFRLNGVTQHGALS